MNVDHEPWYPNTMSNPMPWLDSDDGKCKNCSDKKEKHVTVDGTLTCQFSVPCVLRTIDDCDIEAAHMALELLKSWCLAKDMNLRIVGRVSSGPDRWDHSLLWSLYSDCNHAFIIDGRAAGYTKTLGEMCVAWEFFLKGWDAHKKANPPPVVRDQKKENQWVVLVGVYSYTGKRQYVKDPLESGWSALTDDLEQAHGFSTKKAVIAELERWDDRTRVWLNLDKGGPNVDRRSTLREGT